MADPTINTKPIEDAFLRMANSIKHQEQSSYRLSEAFDKLGEKAVKSLEDKVKNLAKQTGLLTDDQLALIKNTQNLADAIAQKEKDLEKQIKKEIEALEEFNKALEAAGKMNSESGAAAKVAARAKYDEIKNEMLASRASLDAFKSQTDALIANAESLNIFSQHVDKVKNSFKGWVAENLTTRKSFELLKQSATQAIDELNKATAVGLQNSFAAIGWEAMKLKMSFDEFSDVIAKNRDIVRQLGGGAIGINEFSKRIQESSEYLKFMGRDGTIATSKFFGTLKSMGETVSSKDFGTSMKSTQKHFIEFGKMYGETADSFADLMESQFEGETIQAKLNSLHGTAKNQLIEEMMIRTENLKNMGMSNEQIKAFNTQLENIYDPSKNKQVEKIRGAEMSKTYLQQLIQQSGSQALASQMPAFNEMFAAIEQGIDPDDLADMQSNMKDAFKAMGDAEKSLTKQISEKRKAGGNVLTERMGLNIFGERGGDVLHQVKEQAKIVSAAGQHGTLTTAEQASTAKADAEKELTGEVDLYTKAVILVRDATQTYTSVMKNSISIGLLGLAAGAGAAVIGLWKFKTALDLAGKGLGLLGGGTPDLPGSDKGSKGSKARKYGKFALGAAAGAGMIYAGSELGGQGGPEKTPWADTGSKALDWAGKGALLGALIPGLGELGISEAAGGLIGGAAGAGVGMYQNWSDFGSKPSTINPTPDVTAHAEQAAAAAAATESSQSQSTPAEKSNNIIEELKKHTYFLEQISRNTISFKGGNPDMFKGQATRVASNLRTS